VNPRLGLLYPYPFERLRDLLAGVSAGGPEIDLTIGEPQHTTPTVITQTITENLHLLSKYPPTPGTPELRRAIAGWIQRRFGATLDADQQIIPVSGSREALFGFAQATLDPADPGVVLLPNPFYQIYEGAAFLAGARPEYVNNLPSGKPDWDAIPASTWNQVKLAYVCSPRTPAGYCFTEADWQEIFALADRYGFLIAADEPYSEIYNTATPPMGALTVAAKTGFTNLVVFNSLSKRSSAAGLRSGFVAGNAAVIQKYRLYRTYHGAAPSHLVQKASEAAWNDEAHVEENRAHYRAKFDLVQPGEFGGVPEGGFFLWSPVPASFASDEEYTRHVYQQSGIKLLPGSYLARESHGQNPGAGMVRIALVQDRATIAEALDRLRSAA
jgi:N-succinyldiaminopimelate aminotransferase